MKPPVNDGVGVADDAEQRASIPHGKNASSRILGGGSPTE
jgi:hypothetical protein